MKSRSLLLAFFAVLPATIAWAQISGIMLAPDGNPEAGVEIFINRSTFRAVTDDFGQFSLLEVPPGFHELVAYKRGFTLYRAPMRVQSGKSYSLNLKFASTEKKARGKSTPAAVAAFSEAILGPEGLLLFSPDAHVQVETMDNKFRVFSGPVVIEYPNTGYRITAYFSPQAFQGPSEAAYCYQEYQGSNVNQNMGVERSRMAIYQGSLRHWVTAVIAGKSREEGFLEFNEEGKSLDSPPPATPSATPGYSRIRLERPITVQFQGQDKTVLSATDPIDASNTGILINPKGVQLDGAMNQPGLANQLPLDYRPIKDIEGTYAEALRYFYEKVYVQTDKPYYYPGEPLWFKAYVNYYNRGWMDSLSTVMYVELLSAREEMRVQKTFRIERGMSHGDFILPDSLPEGTYYLRAYTNLRLNFGDSGLFTKPLPVLRLTDKAEHVPTQPATEPSKLQIAPDKQVYKTRDKISLDLRLAEDLSKSAHFSISITDAAQVIPIPEKQNILNAFPIDPREIPRIEELTHRIERGVSFYGQFLNTKGQPEKTQLSFIQWKTGDVISAETGDDGMFWQTGLQFTDSAQFSYKSDKAKGRPYGKVVVQPRDIPRLERTDAPEIRLMQAGNVQRIFSEYEVPKDSKLLEEVEIRGKRPQDTDFERNKRRPYGMPDYTLTSDRLNVASGNLLYALVGKVPGLIVNPSQGVVYFTRAYGTSFTQSAGPMVTINDIPMAGDAGTILQTIDFNTIESIEFTKRLNSLYGSQGANGVISVYTKTGMSVDNTDPNFQTIKLPGFSRTRPFQAPDHGTSKNDGPADYRSTLYWNPEVTTDEATGTARISFFASDLAGLYRVVVEGVTSEGRPVRAEIFLPIEER